MKIDNVRISMWGQAWVLTLFFVALSAPWIAAGSTGEKPLRMKPIQVKAGTLRGVVRGYTSKPFAATSLELQDSKGKTFARTMTNKRGEFLFKNIPAGKYTAVIGGRVRLPLTMTSEATVSRLIIVPSFARGGIKPSTTAAKPAGGAAPDGTSTTWTWVLIGGGAAAAAVSIPIIFHSGGSKSRRPISP